MMEVRAATVDDATIMGEIHYYTWLSTYSRLIDQGFLKSHSIQKSTHYFQSIQCINHLVGIINNQVIGFIGYGPSREESLPNYGEITGLYILKAYQQQGYGKILLQEALTVLTKMGYSQYYLWILAENQGAMHFYEQNGFCHDGQTKQHLLGKPVIERRYLRKELYGPNN